MFLCTLGVWDMAEAKPAYSALKNNLTYAMIFAMLLRCDIRKVLKLGLFTAGVASRASLLELGEAPAWIATGFIVLGIRMALMGYVVGTPLAVVCAHIMESLA